MSSLIIPSSPKFIPLKVTRIADSSGDKRSKVRHKQDWMKEETK